MKNLFPPYLFVLCSFYMIGLKYLFPIKHLIPNPYHYFGYVLLTLGLTMVVSIVTKFKQRETEINTFKEPKNLVIDGLFEYSRNPIYLGLLTALTGIWILLGAPLSSLVGVAVFFIVANHFYIPHEEAKMEQIFGMDYLNYKSKVRRWI